MLLGRPVGGSLGWQAQITPVMLLAMKSQDFGWYFAKPLVPLKSHKSSKCNNTAQPLHWLHQWCPKSSDVISNRLDPFIWIRGDVAGKRRRHAGQRPWTTGFGHPFVTPSVYQVKTFWLLNCLNRCRFLHAHQSNFIGLRSGWDMAVHENLRKSAVSEKLNLIKRLVSIDKRG